MSCLLIPCKNAVIINRKEFVLQIIPNKAHRKWHEFHGKILQASKTVYDLPIHGIYWLHIYLLQWGRETIECSWIWNAQQHGAEYPVKRIRSYTLHQCRTASCGSSRLFRELTGRYRKHGRCKACGAIQELWLCKYIRICKQCGRKTGKAGLPTADEKEVQITSSDNHHKWTGSLRR